MSRKQTVEAPEGTPLAALLRACEVVGGQTALARKLGIKSQGTVSNWIGKQKRCPAERVLEVEAACEGKVTRFELRPDMYPRERARPRGRRSNALIEA